LSHTHVIDTYNNIIGMPYYIEVLCHRIYATTCHLSWLSIHAVNLN